MRGPAGTIWGDPIRPLNGIDGLRGIEISGDHNTVGLFIASLRQSGYRSAKIYLRQGAEARTGSTRPARYHADSAFALRVSMPGGSWSKQLTNKRVVLDIKAPR